MHILVLNSGSSSLKFQVIDIVITETGECQAHYLAKGLVESIGSNAQLTFTVSGKQKTRQNKPIKNHQIAIDTILQWLVSPQAEIDAIQSFDDIQAVGHRVVHGGERFAKSILIDQTVISGIEKCMELAPLHNPANLKGIEAITALLGSDIPQVAVFDTAFHATLSEAAYLYGLPYQFYRRYKIRRYGFHGNSHRYIAYKYRKIHNIPAKEVNIISLHLGNGCSACSIHAGKSIDTSMGFTPLDGLVMGTRSGDIDASILNYLHSKEGMDFAEIDNLLNKQSGLLGISGLTSDMREILDEANEHDDRRAKLAIEIFCRNIRKYIAAYFVEASGKVDAIVFTGGIGENSAQIREIICTQLIAIGLEFDPLANNQGLDNCEYRQISTPDSKLKAWVIPTNEEFIIAVDTIREVTLKKSACG
ncbi:MAG: acetate kinase [Osedax symbiont Rs1]|nr:MAG: acetate kinase [Osedax symbiont Rs1]